MKKLIFSLFVSISTVSAYAATEKAAEKLVKKYSETIACQLEETKYTAVKVSSREVNQLGDVYLVHWTGDIGCGGGNGTGDISQFTMVVERSPSVGSRLIIDGDAKLPELDIRYVKTISIKDGVIYINGFAWADNDSAHNPTKPVSYKLKFVNENGDSGKFVKIK